MSITQDRKTTRLQPGQAWFEELAFKLLHPAQQAIIQALRESPQGLSKEDLQVIVEGRGHRGLDHHLGRLRKLNAIEIKASPTGPVRLSYRLTERPGLERE